MKLKMGVVLLAVFMTSACSGISVNQDFNPAADFAALSTWDWMPVPNQTSDNPLVDQRVRAAVEAGLQAKGLRKVDSGEPTFRVGYQIILEDKVNYQTVNSYYGTGWGYRGIYGVRGGPVMGTSQTYATEYTMGSLVIDFFDVSSKELVWRGSAEGKINETADPVQRQERAQEAVTKILEQFPPNG